MQGAEVSAKSAMPSMNMVGPNLVGRETQPGVYKLSGNFVPGLWRLEIQIIPRGGGIHKQIVRMPVK